MGNSVVFPVDVKGEQVDLPFVAAKEPAWLEAQSLADWAPATSNPIVNLHLDQNQDGTYQPISSWSGGRITKRKDLS